MKLTLRNKVQISGMIRKHNMDRCTVLAKGANIAIPETEDAGGKPQFVSTKQFNKIWDRVNRHVQNI